MKNSTCFGLTHMSQNNEFKIVKPAATFNSRKSQSHDKRCKGGLPIFKIPVLIDHSLNENSVFFKCFVTFLVSNRCKINEFEIEIEKGLTKWDMIG